ncbi:hypothetical protein HDU91_001152, partial [Kappamyces sp. JEL0680]
MNLLLWLLPLTQCKPSINQAVREFLYPTFQEFEFEEFKIRSEKLAVVQPSFQGFKVVNGISKLRFHGPSHETINNARLKKRSGPGRQPEICDAGLDTAIDAANQFMGVRKLQPESSAGEKVFFEQDDGTLVMAWHVFDSKHDNRVWVIDACAGKVLHVYNRVHRLDQALVYPDHTAPAFGSTPQHQVSLENIVSTPISIRGPDFASSNTCFAYRCISAPNGSCFLNESVCVDPTSGLVKGKDYFTSTMYFATDGREINYDYDWQANGYVNNSVIMAWVNAPVGASRLSKPSNNIWGSDLPWGNYTGFEQNDAIIELQAYYYLSRHASFLRELLGDPSFCFLGSGPNCTVSDAASNSTLAQNSSPIYFFGNYQQLKTYPDSSSQYPDFLSQLAKGAGKSVEDPIYFDQSDSYTNAFYNHMPFAAAVNCSDAGCVDQSTYPFSHFAFGQDRGSSADWGLNECIVYHELTHALVAQFIPLLPSYVWGSTGLQSDPGALNEAWADYFAAIHCQYSDFTKTYSGHPRRNLDNAFTCSDMVGEIHVDSMVFSGALWQVRSAIPTYSSLNGSADQTAFDRVVLHALMLGKETDNFATQLGLVQDLLRNDSRLAVLGPLAQTVFSERELGCKRLQLFEESGDPTFQLPPNSYTSVNISTLPNQLLFRPRRSDWALKLRWRQWTESGFLGKLDIGYAKQSLQFLVSACQIVLKGTQATNVEAFSNCSGSLQPI